MNQHAKEYLLEFSENQEDWVKALIFGAIENNGEISEEKIEDIYHTFKSNGDFNLEKPNIASNDSEDEILITNLKHCKGVNALSKNQNIRFSTNITMLYGMNGAGKSSYFKILNELVGGNQIKKILSNIYEDDPNEIEVELKYIKKNNPEKTIYWDGSSRSIQGLNKSKVFDSSYLNGLLEQRKTDETLVQPLGLNLFTYLVRKLDSFKEKLINDADKLRQSKPKIITDTFSQDLKTSFENHNFELELVKTIESKFSISNEELESFSEISDSITALKQNNINDKITIETTKQIELGKIKSAFDTYKSELEKYLSSAREELKRYESCKKANTEAKRNFEVLMELPEVDSNEWKEFVTKGAEYSKKIEASSENCIYCLQPLQTDQSIKLVKAYSEFLSDDTGQKLLESENKISEIKNEITSLTSGINVPENISSYLSEQRYSLGNEDNWLKELDKYHDGLNKVKSTLLKACAKKQLNNDVSIPTIELLSNELVRLSDKAKTLVESLTKENKEKADKILGLEKKLKALAEHKSINEQSDVINNWFKIHRKEQSLREKAKGIKTNQLTSLSNICHSELLTENLKTNFEAELESLGYKKLKVNLENAGGSKGTSSTKLVLIKSNNVKSILSEGEQKAVALALFIAETKMQKGKNPIILDDPVTSLDHKIASKFANRLIQLDNQIIIFNHNRLFLDAFETQKNHHVCKNFIACSNSKGKHIAIYEVLDEGKNSKGVLTNFKTNKARAHINDAKSLLNHTPFTEHLKVAGLLRKTVECCIDEVVFNHQIPTKFTNKNSRIQWAELKKLNNNESIISKLEEIHSRASGGELHNGTEHDENKIDRGEFVEMFNILENYLN